MTLSNCIFFMYRLNIYVNKDIQLTLCGFFYRLIDLFVFNITLSPREFSECWLIRLRQKRFIWISTSVSNKGKKWVCLERYYYLNICSNRHIHHIFNTNHFNLFHSKSGRILTSLIQFLYSIFDNKLTIKLFKFKLFYNYIRYCRENSYLI